MAMRKIALMLSISLFWGGIESISFGKEFRSDQLDEISRCICVDWPSQHDTTLTVSHANRDVAIRVAGDCVEHIGFRIFPEPIREAMVNPFIANFVERYWLSLTLPLERQKSVAQQLKEDRFMFHVGGVGSIDAIQRDSALSFSCQATPTIVDMAWNKGGKQICRISFPVDYELILGRRMLENDRRLPQEIAAVKVPERPVRSVDDSHPHYADSLSSILVEHEGSYLDCALKSERYYAVGGDGVTLVPVFDAGRCVESLSNLFTDCDIEAAGNIRLSIRHKTFGLKEQPIETTIQKFVAYSMLNGCVPYVGVISVDEDNSGVADMLVIMRNERIGYNHLLRVSVPLDCISSGEGVATARLNAFIPSSNIKNLFKN